MTLPVHPRTSELTPFLHRFALKLGRALVHAGLDRTQGPSFIWPRLGRSWVRGSLLTSCSRQDDIRGHGTTPADTGRHLEPKSVRGASNLRIRCPKGRGSSTLPSRTTSDLRIFSSSLYRQSAGETFLLTLAHENFVSSCPGTRPGPRLLGRLPMASLPDPRRCGCLDRRNRKGKPDGPWLLRALPGNPPPASACSSAALRYGRVIELTEGSRLGGRRGAEGPVPAR